MKRGTKVLIAILLVLGLTVACLRYWLAGENSTENRPANIATPAEEKQPVLMAKVIVSGDVVRSGVNEFDPASPKRLARIIQDAGWTPSSDLKRVRVTRWTQTLEYNVDAILSGMSPKNDFPLKDGDRVFVPRMSREH